MNPERGDHPTATTEKQPKKPSQQATTPPQQPGG